MSLQQQERIKSLEARVSALEAALEAKSAALETAYLAPVATKDDLQQAIVQKVMAMEADLAALTAGKAPSKRPMCPKCGVKPNYYMHVRWCQGVKGPETP
jgi:hypothetical protein